MCFQKRISGDEWKLRSGIRQGGVTSSLILFYLIGVLTDITNLPLVRKLSDNKVNTFCYNDGNAILVLTENTYIICLIR